MQVHRIENAVKAFEGTIPPNRFSHHVLALLLQGDGTKVIGCHRFDVSNDLALFVPANCIHATPSWSLDNRGFMVTFSESFLLESGVPASLVNHFLLFRETEIPYRRLDTDMVAQITSVFNGMISLGEANHVDTRKLLALVILCLCHFLPGKTNYHRQASSPRRTHATTPIHTPHSPFTIWSGHGSKTRPCSSPHVRYLRFRSSSEDPFPSTIAQCRYRIIRHLNLPEIMVTPLVDQSFQSHLKTETKCVD